jgi:hypothetical protein
MGFLRKNVNLGREELVERKHNETIQNHIYDKFEVLLLKK